MLYLKVKPVFDLVIKFNFQTLLFPAIIVADIFSMFVGFFFITVIKTKNVEKNEFSYHLRSNFSNFLENILLTLILFRALSNVIHTNFIIFLNISRCFKAWYSCFLFTLS